MMHAVARITARRRREMATFLRSEGHSYRAIASALGIGKSQVAEDLAELSGTGQLEEPEHIIGLSGKSYPARRPSLVVAKSRLEAERVQTALENLDTLPSGRVLDVKRIERSWSGGSRAAISAWWLNETFSRRTGSGVGRGSRSSFRLRN